MPNKAGTEHLPTRILRVKLAVVEHEVQPFVVVGTGFELCFVFAVVYGELSSRQVSLKNNAQQTIWHPSSLQDRRI